MVAIALAVLAVTSTVALALLLRRHRPAHRPDLLGRVEPLPAGVKHLASGVSDLSDLGLHLPAAKGALERRRLGALLALR